MGDHRWGFEDLDDSEYEEISGRRPVRQPTEPEQTVSGQDADRVVTVQVTLTGDVAAVHLATDWQRSVDPRVLGESVRAAANAATVAAMTAQLDRVEQQPPPVAAADHVDTTPLTRRDVDRLLDAVTADLADFSRRAAEIIDHPVSTQSARRHVSGTAQRGQVLQVSVEPGWAARARSSEIEGELLEVLGWLRRQSTPGDLAQGPQSSAIAELTALASDPATLLRRIGLDPRQPTEGSNGR
ncbi:MAG TPA: hypothetical protein VHH34_01480 [Pseudonocardiaceae bacterium]|nr:hypothetical protein [Pseudonocardiaceae bacterium]